MSDTEEPRARRALPARDDPSDDAEAPRGSRRLWEPTAAADPQPSDPQPAGVTPIPPPAPVMPTSEAAPASAGRRFSAAELPSEAERPLPRRSALSPAATRARSPRSADEADSAADATEPRWAFAWTPRRKALVGAVAVVAVVGVVAASQLLRPQTTVQAPTPTPSAVTVEPVATYLLQPADLAGVRAGASWTAATTATTVEAGTPQPTCLPPAAELRVAPASSLVRTFSPADGQEGGVLHQVDTYATAADAEAAYDQRLSQLGACELNTAWVRSAAEVDGLADDASALTLVLQDVQAEYHTIVLSRTGTRVNVMDATQPDEAPGLQPVVTALAAASARQCADSGGACVTQPEIAAAIPPVVAPAGWLAPVDLPRITPGAGVWRGADLAQMRLAGSRCEAVDLVSVAGTTASAQRTSLLEDDTAAPTGFGVDEAIYTFANAADAATFARTLTTNIDQCAARTATAEVARTAELGGNAPGAAWVVTRKVSSAAATARFRVAVQVAGNRVVYLMGNPSATFDFSDDAWTAVAVRAGERLTQFP